MPLIVTPRQLNQRAELYHQLGIMIAAGLSVHKSLEHLQTHPPSLSLRAPVSRLLTELTEGHTVTESLQRIGKWMPSFDLALVESGERSGRLDACFKLLSIYYNERAQMLRQMMSDIAYPAFMFHFSVVLFSFLDYLKTPNVVRFFTEVLIIFVPLYAAVFLIIYACQGRHGEAWRARLEEIFSYVPLLGAARRELALARLTTALESLLNAGVPIITAWELAATASGSPELARVVRGWKEPIENGSSFSELITNSGKFPDLFSNLYHTGEVSGTLDQSLLRLHTLYQEQGLAKMRNLSQWTPKLIYFGLLIVIGWKIVSWYAASVAEWSNIKM